MNSVRITRKIFQQQGREKRRLAHTHSIQSHDQQHTLGDFLELETNFVPRQKFNIFRSFKFTSYQYFLSRNARKNCLPEIKKRKRKKNYSVKHSKLHHDNRIPTTKFYLSILTYAFLFIYLFKYFLCTKILQCILFYFTKH